MDITGWVFADEDEDDLKKEVYENVHDVWCQDPVVMDVIRSFEKRSAEGMIKYGKSLEDNDTKSIVEWITDVQEEMQDAILYLEKLKQTLGSKP